MHKMTCEHNMMLGILDGMVEKRIEPGPLATQVARSIRRLREKQRVSYAELAKRLAEAGRPIPLLGLSRMENGDRRIDLDDLVAVAQALRVPPIWLIFPVGVPEDDEVEVTPGVQIPVEAALAWFNGDGDAFYDYFGQGDYDAQTELWAWYDMPKDVDRLYVAGNSLLRLNRAHRQYLLEWYHLWDRSSRVQEAIDQPTGRFVFALASLIEENLRLIRNEMRQQGLPLPRLPEALRGRFEVEQAGEHKQAGEDQKGSATS